MSEEYPRVMPPGGSRLKKSDGNFPFSPKPKAPEPPKPKLEPQTTVRDGREFPCGQCGAALNYDPTLAVLKCQYCGHEQSVPQSADQVNELCFKTYFEHGSVAEEVLAGTEGERRCDGCGANVLITAEKATDACPFCGTHLDNPVTAAKPMMAPGGLLPFMVDKQGAQTEFRKWVNSRWFAPNAFKDMDRLDRVNGLYVPYWTYDAMTWSFYTGQRGDHYYVTVGSGKNRRTEQRTRWTSVSGRVDHWFDDVLVCASKSLPDKQVEELEPWDLKGAVPYQPAYLSGFQTERYQVSAQDGFDLAKVRMDKQIREFICQQIGGDVQRISSVQTQIDGVTFKYLLLPIWLAVYRYDNKPYRVLVNARTGEVQGERPWSWVKIALAVIAGSGLIGLIVYYFMQAQ